MGIQVSDSVTDGWVVAEALHLPCGSLTVLWPFDKVIQNLPLLASLVGTLTCSGAQPVGKCQACHPSTQQVGAGGLPRAQGQPEL